MQIYVSLSNDYECVFYISEPEDEDVDRARDILLEPAKEEREKGEHQDLFFFIGADVSSFKMLNLCQFLYLIERHLGPSSVFAIK